MTFRVKQLEHRSTPVQTLVRKMSRPDGGILETSVHLVAEKAEQQPSLSNESVPADSVGSQNIVVTPTLREQELGWSTERCEKMSLRDADPASVRTPDLGVLLVA